MSEPEPVPPTQGVVERSRVTGTGDDGLSLRAEPRSASERLKTIPDGAELELTGEEQEADGRTWRAVRDPSDGMTGWVAAEFLEIGGSGE
jgi:Bacterial SH3 domain